MYVWVPKATKTSSGVLRVDFVAFYLWNDCKEVESWLCYVFLLKKWCNYCCVYKKFESIEVHSFFVLECTMLMSVQASWVCQCDGMLVQRLEADFKVTLQQQNSLEDWATWLKNVVSVVLKPYQGKPNFTKAARQFLLKWSFYRWEHDFCVLGYLASNTSFVISLQL